VNDKKLVKEKEFFDATWDRVVLVKILFLKNHGDLSIHSPFLSQNSEQKKNRQTILGRILCTRAGRF